MSNNKQNSVEWLFEEQFNSFEKFNNGGFSFSEYMAHNLTLREQAKAMHKEEIIDSFGVGCQVEASRLIGYHKMAEQYYAETFGGNK